MYMIIGGITIAVLVAILFVFPTTINDALKASENDHKRNDQ